MPETSAILLTLIVYKLALLAVGWWAGTRSHSPGEFFLGGRRLGPWLGALSASASSSSAWTLLGVSGAAYAWGVSALWIVPACLGGIVFNWWVLAPRLRRLSAETGALTVTDVLAGPRGRPGAAAIRAVATAIVLVSLMAYVASQFQGAGKAFHETFDLSMPAAVGIGSAIVIIYTMMGGFWAVSVTDALQGLVMVAAATVLPAAAVVAVGGPVALYDAIASVPVEGYASLSRNLGPVAGAGFVLGVLGIGVGSPGQPHVVNRFMAMKDQRAIVSGRRIAVVWATAMFGGMVVLGLCARVLLPDLGDPEVAFITTTRALFPPVVAGVMLAAVLSAIMSTADSQLLVAASAVAHDVGTPSTPGRVVWRSRLAILGLSLAAVGAALGGDATIFKRVLFAWTAMGAAFGPLLVVLACGRRVDPPRRLAAICVGFVTAVAAYWWPTTSGTIGERAVPFAIALAVAWWPSRRGDRGSSG